LNNFVSAGIFRELAMKLSSTTAALSSLLKGGMVALTRADAAASRALFQ
jgi:hypothetical protein